MPDSLKLPYTRILDPQGCLLEGLPAWADDSALLARLYRQMVLTRLFDQKAVALQRTGRIGGAQPVPCRHRACHVYHRHRCSCAGDNR